LIIGIDASRAFVPRPTGTERYATAVIDHLAACGGHTYRLYFRTAPAIPPPDGASVRVLPAARLWTHVRLAAEVALHPPDVLFVPAHVLPLVTRPPAVVTVHDLGYRAFPEAHTWRQRAYLRWTTRRHARTAAHILAVSAATRDDLVKLDGADPARVTVVHLGVGPEFRPAPPIDVARVRAALDLPEGGDYLLHVGTLQPRKNLPRLLEAFARAVAGRADVALVLAGARGWGGEDLDGLARRLGIADRVRLTGYLPHADLPALYTGALALVMPSLHEGFGLPVLEAMACGVPVACSATSSLPEVAGGAALLFDPLDVDDVAGAIARLIRDAGVRSALAAAGPRQAARFTWDRCARETLAVLEAVGRGGRRTDAPARGGRRVFQRVAVDDEGEAPRARETTNAGRVCGDMRSRGPPRAGDDAASVKMNPAPTPERSPRILAVKLADFGDALLTTPAIRRLRRALPAARIDVLTTPIGAVAYRHSGLVDDVLVFEKTAYDRVGGALARPLAPIRLGRGLRARRYDAVALLHPLTTRFGAVKHAGLVLATGAPVRAGLARLGSRRAWFLTHAAEDVGYDRAHVVEAAVAVVEALIAALPHPPAGRPADGAPVASANVAPGSPGTIVGWDRSLAFVPGAAAEAAADALLAALPADGRPRVAIHPGTGAYSPARRWSAEGFATVADGLADDGAHVVLVGTAADGAEAVRARCRRPVVDLAGRTDLPTLGALLARMDLLVGNDSGVTHLATAVGTPVVAVFGPSNAGAWGPWWPGVDRDGRPAPSPHRVVHLALPCQPCFYAGHRLGDRRGCATRDCLAWLPPSRVLAAARESLTERRGT